MNLHTNNIFFEEGYFTQVSEDSILDNNKLFLILILLLIYWWNCIMKMYYSLLQFEFTLN